MFKQIGAIDFSKDTIDFDKLFEISIEANAQDVTDEDDFYRVVTLPEDFRVALNTLKKQV